MATHAANKVLLLVPTTAPHLRSSLLERLAKAGLHESSDYRLLPMDHDFNSDSSFPDHTIGGVAVAPVRPSKDLIDSLLNKHIPRVTWVHSLWAGVDAILSDGLRARTDVVLTNAKHAFSESLGEHAILGALHFAKRVARCTQQYREKKWEKYQVQMLKGATMCIVGYGSIGAQVAKRAHAFEMNVIAVKRDPTKIDDDVRKFVHKVYDSTSLPEILPKSDYVVSILPGTPDTRHFWNKERLGYLSPNAVFMNLGRGTSVDETALVTALEDGSLRGAVLDVFEQEPLPPSSPLWTVGEVKLLFTPHCADYTAYYWDHAADICVDNIVSFRHKSPLRNIVDKISGY